MLGVGLEKPVEFFPSIDPKSVYVNIDPPEGADLDYMDNVSRQTELAILAAPQVGPSLSPAEYAAAYRPQKHFKNDGAVLAQ